MSSLICPGDLTQSHSLWRHCSFLLRCYIHFVYLGVFTLYNGIGLVWHLKQESLQMMKSLIGVKHTAELLKIAYIWLFVAKTAFISAQEGEVFFRPRKQNTTKIILEVRQMLWKGPLCHFKFMLILRLLTWVIPTRVKSVWTENTLLDNDHY